MECLSMDTERSHSKCAIGHGGCRVVHAEKESCGWKYNVEIWGYVGSYIPKMERGNLSHGHIID